MYRSKTRFRYGTTIKNVKKSSVNSGILTEDIKYTLRVVSGFSVRGRYINLRLIPDKQACKAYSMRHVR
jgi:hypothetical protein